MIIAFFREYRFWYLMYLVQAMAFLMTFYLYRLPLSYFIYSGLVSTVLIMLITLTLYYRFRQKMLLLRDFAFHPDTYTLTKPSDQAYLAIIDKEKDDTTEALLTLKKRENDLQQIIKMWAHQMKVPLSALSLMLQTNSLSPTDISLQLQNLNHYLSNLLNYLKLTNQVSDFVFEKVSVRAVMVDLLKEFRIHFLKKDIQLTLEGDWQVISDRKWLRFALSQILDNALKYSQEKGKISIQMTDNDITISDKGIGILAEDLPRLFEQGFTGFNGREHQKATGFGLYMTKLILDELDLSITITSHIDVGTDVRISRSHLDN